MSACPHSNVRCLSEFELIRKYQCEGCGAVMMCACDESVGHRILAPGQANLLRQIRSKKPANHSDSTALKSDGPTVTQPEIEYFSRALFR